MAAVWECSTHSPGTQASKEIVDLGHATLWFASKELTPGKKLKDFLGGANEKSKVIVKLSTRLVSRLFLF